MKTKKTFAAVLGGLVFMSGIVGVRAQDVDSVAPVIVKTVPEAGGKNVAAGVAEIKITFSKPMSDNSWSWSSAWKDSEPHMLDKPKYDSDGRTCIVKVQLEPGKTYGYWLNSQNFHGFKDAQGHPAIPYLLVFQTAEK